MTDLESTALKRELSDEEEKLLDEYGVLVRNLKAYFPSVDDPEDKSAEFIKEYQLLGEKSKKFEGIIDQIDKSIKRPGEFSKVLEMTLGVKYTRDQTSEYMLDLYNRLTKQDDTAIKAEKDVDARFDYYFSRKVKLPFVVPKYGSNIVPLWSIGLTGFILAIIGWAGFRFLENVPVVWQIFLAILIIGTILFGLVAITMFFLRDETVNADKYADREAALQQYRAAKKQKKSTSRWRLSSFRE